MKKLLILDQRDLVDNGPPTALDFARRMIDCGSKAEFDRVVERIPEAQRKSVAKVVSEGWSRWHADCPSKHEEGNIHQILCDCMFSFMQSHGE